MKQRVILGILFLAAMAIGADAQTQAPNEVYVGQSFQVAGTHDGVNVSEYRLYRAGTKVATVPASARNASTGEVAFPARTESAVSTGVLYEMSAANINASGEAESAKSSINVVVKVAPPTTPNPLTLPKLIRIP